MVFLGTFIMNKKSGVLLFVIAVFIAVAVFATLYRDEKPVFDDANVYGDYEEIVGDIAMIDRSDYSLNDIHVYANNKGLVFPETLPEGESAFFCYHKSCNSDAGIINRAQIYLSTYYSGGDFSKEINRLSEICVDWAVEQKRSVYTETLFAKPAYVLCYNDNSEYEYAIIDKENFNIVYVYFYAIGKKSNLVFDNSLVPDKALKESDFDKALTDRGRYSIDYSNA